MKRFVRSAIAVTVLCVAAAGLGAEALSVVSINAWSGLTDGGVFHVREYEDRAEREFRFDLLTTRLAEAAPQIIAVQEANPLPRYGERLAAALSYDLLYHTRQAGVRIGPVGLPTNLREGSVLLASQELSLADPLRTQLTGGGAGNLFAFQLGSASQVFGGRVSVAGRTVYVFTTRWTESPPAGAARLTELVSQYDADELPADAFLDTLREAVEGAEVRLREARRTLTFINEQAGEAPVILMGSFYAAPDSDEIVMLKEAGFLDVFASVGSGTPYTYDSLANTNIQEHELVVSGDSVRRRIDYIFIRGRGISARSARVVFQDPTYGVHLSDHFGVQAELWVEPAE